jgi:hypothetical protein
MIEIIRVNLATWFDHIRFRVSSVGLEYTDVSKWRGPALLCWIAWIAWIALTIGKVAQVRMPKVSIIWIEHEFEIVTRDMVTCGVFQLSLTESDWTLIVA